MFVGEGLKTHTNLTTRMPVFSAMVRTFPKKITCFEGYQLHYSVSLGFKIDSINYQVFITVLRIHDISSLSYTLHFMKRENSQFLTIYLTSKIFNFNEN